MKLPILPGLRRVAPAVALALPIVVLVPLTTTSAAPALAPVVQIKNFAFTPQLLTVKPGTTVTWTNTDEDPHTVTATDHSFHSAALDSGEKFSFTFTKPGDYGYFCSLHPHMTAKIVVRS